MNDSILAMLSLAPLISIQQEAKNAHWIKQITQGSSILNHRKVFIVSIFA